MSSLILSYFFIGVMIMKKYNEYYQRNKQLDKMYDDRYGGLVDNLYEKNCLELIVEICEFANESRCFKYWTVKKPDRELMLEEYADCLSMLFCIFNAHAIDDVLVLDIELSDDIVLMFNELIRMCTMLMDKSNVDRELLLKIFTYLLHIGKLLDISDEELLDACYMKLGKNIERLNSDY